MVELELLGVSTDGQLQHILVLRHEDRILPIFTTREMAETIQLGHMKEKLGRPLTHDLICNLLAGMGGELKSVTIYKLEDRTFFAYLNIEQKGDNGEVRQVLRIDSRASDSIALAVRAGCPIYASQEVMDEAGQELMIEEDDSSEDPEL
ncbi:MAG TPA: bifunctional nuclease family protein [Candidatus Hydrogenedentes bacterium]|nr:bifunctional nuclease family protein [Candidatus Hydrogenedentota bacterium]HIJ73049.1 bifunctional nuclease family protein [Candidatus Hydrogenedentota bacterium]